MIHTHSYDALVNGGGGAGLMAAIMSSVDSALNSSSTLITLDFIQPRRGHMSSQQMARTGRITTLVLVALAALWAPAIDSFPGLFAYLQQTFAYVTPPLVAVFLIGFFGSWLAPSAALYATISGHLLSAAWFVATQAGWLSLHFSIVAGILFAATLLLCVAWQALLRQPATGVAQRVPPAASVSGMPADVRWGAAALALLTVLLVVSFW